MHQAVAVSAEGVVEEPRPGRISAGEVPDYRAVLVDAPEEPREPHLPFCKGSGVLLAGGSLPGLGAGGIGDLFNEDVPHLTERGGDEAVVHGVLPASREHSEGGLPEPCHVLEDDVAAVSREIVGGEAPLYRAPCYRAPGVHAVEHRDETEEARFPGAVSAVHLGVFPDAELCRYLGAGARA